MKVCNNSAKMGKPAWQHKVSERVLECLIREEQTYSTIIDFRKAIHSVNHQVVIGDKESSSILKTEKEANKFKRRGKINNYSEK